MFTRYPREAGLQGLEIDWAVVVATLLGPIIAVAITLWHQSRNSRKQSRMDLFSVMMRWRKHPMADFVGSLNLVPVHFNADRMVMQRYTELMTLFEDSGWRSPDHEVRRRLIDQTDTKIAYLLSAMAKAVGTPIDQLHILKGAYAPQGWADEEQIARETRDGLRSMLRGGYLPVVVMNGPTVPQPSAPPDGSTPAPAGEPSAPEPTDTQG